MNTYVGTGPNALKEIFDNAENASLAAHRMRQEEHDQELHRQAGFLGSVWRAIKRIVFRCRPVSQADEYIKPTILCLNELDAIAGQRGAQPIDHQERINTLLQLLNSIDEHPHVFVVGTSNEETEYFDKALRRPGRMGAPLRIPLPDEADRFEIIKYYMQKAPTLSPLIRIPGFVKFAWLEQLQRNKTPFDHMLPAARPGRYAFWRSIVERTRTFSGDELRQLFNDAVMIAGDKEKKQFGKLCEEYRADDMDKEHQADDDMDKIAKKFKFYLGRAHLEKALENMLAEMPPDRRERCRASRPENLAQSSGSTAGHSVGLGTQVAAEVKRRAGDQNSDPATMDGDDPSEF